MLSWRCCLYRFFRMYDLYMSFLFGGKLEAPLNPAKTVVRDVRIALRKIERDEMNAIKQEKALLSKLKALGTQRKLEACQSQAKDLVSATARQSVGSDEIAVDRTESKTGCGRVYWHDTKHTGTHCQAAGRVEQAIVPQGNAKGAPGISTTKHSVYRRTRNTE